MEPFKDYQDIIKTALARNILPKGINESRQMFGLSAPNVSARYSLMDFEAGRSKLSLSSDLTAVTKKMGVKPIENQLIGHHPDFSYLKSANTTEKHYIISAFIDIKGSTNLFKKYDEETNMIITNTIQLAAINVCQLFGGFIQRIQGDGLFVYFGGKNVDKSMASQHCLTALSLFTYFVKNDLKNVFEQHGIEKIFTRIGIDFGDDDVVLWGMAGKADSSEIATYSLHTSLASKMQGYAGSNEIVVGQFLKDRAKFDEKLYSVVNGQRYIFSNPDKAFNYTQYVFDWYKYLRAAQFIVSATDGTITIKPQITAVPDIAALKSLASQNKPYAK